MIAPEKKIEEFQREDIDRIKRLWGFSWVRMGRYLGQSDDYWRRKYYNSDHFHKSDRACLWLMELIWINLYSRKDQ